MIDTPADLPALTHKWVWLNYNFAILYPRPSAKYVCTDFCFFLSTRILFNLFYYIEYKRTHLCLKCGLTHFFPLLVHSATLCCHEVSQLKIHDHQINVSISQCIPKVYPQPSLKDLLEDMLSTLTHNTSYLPPTVYCTIRGDSVWQCQHRLCSDSCMLAEQQQLQFSVYLHWIECIQL